MPTKILAIDDSKTMRLAIKITFAAEDADVTSVSKGSEAVARAKQLGADVVLVDANLAAGEPSGYDVCRAIKQDPSTASIPVVMLVSGQTGADDAKLAAVGADDWIAKPFDTQELIDKVGAVQGKPAAKPAATAAAAPPTRPAPAVSEPVAAQSGTSKRIRQQNRTQMGMPSPAATPTPAPAPPVTATPAPPPRPARQAAAAAAPAPRAVRQAAPAPTPRAAAPAPRAAAPAPRAAAPAPRAAAPARSATPAAAMTPASSAAGGGIPIAIPIPFTAADSPTPGMIARIQQAAGTGGVDPKVAEVLASLSHDVIERIVWEVVPDLAESIIREQQSRSA